MLENVIAAMIVLAAAWWVGRRMLRTIGSAKGGQASGCGSCGNCAKSTTAAGSPRIVSIGSQREQRSAESNSD